MEQEKELEILARLERIERTLRIGLSRVMDAQACADYLGITLPSRARTCAYDGL